MGNHTDPNSCKNRKAVKPLKHWAVEAANKVQPTSKNEDERKKWMDAYINEAGAGSWKCVCPKEKKIDSPVASCPNKHSIEVILKRKQRMDQHNWWPPEGDIAYRREPYEMQHTCGHKEGKLASMGNIRVNNISAGTCTVAFPMFYKEIEDWLKERLQG